MDTNTAFGYWVKAAPYTGFKMEKFSRPAYVGDKATPDSLNALTIGQLIDLGGIGTTSDGFYKIVETVLGMAREEVDMARAVDVVRFVGWVSGEVEKIVKLFKQLNAKPTRQERQAGIDNLKFGLFGMLDWYALRMRITDHDAVLKTPWLRIYKCMDMDAKKRAFDARLQKIQADEMAHSKH